MEDEELIMATACFLLLNKKKNRRLIWMRKTLKCREKYSGSEYIADLRIDGILSNFVRVTDSDFETLLNSISAKIAKTDTNFRKSIDVVERLAVTLRFLSSGESYRSLGDTFKISPQSISLIIPEVCEALVEVLQEYIQVICFRFLFFLKNQKDTE